MIRISMESEEGKLKKKKVESECWFRASQWLSAKQEIWVLSLEEEMAIHSSFLA